MVKSNAVNRTDKQIGILLFAIALAIYLRMAAPDLLGGDSGEFQFAAWRWGLAHPTGYPLYLLIGGLWQHILRILGIDPAAAVNSLSSIMGAAAVSLIYLLMRNWLTGPLFTVRTVALFTALLLAVNPTFWSQNLIAEVYALHAVFILLIFLAAQSIEIAYRSDAGREPPLPNIILLASFVGLSLAHHGMTLLLLPGLLVYLYVLDPKLLRSRRVWTSALPAALLPLLFYLYVPLRSGPAASPWYHQRLGDGVLILYDGTWQAFWDYVSGRAISVGFHDPTQAIANIRRAALLWRLHFGWSGLVLIGLGLAYLIRRRNVPLLAITLTYVGLQQLFNLFYAIDDILVYYIPIYVMATIWAGYGAFSLAVGEWYRPPSSSKTASKAADKPAIADRTEPEATTGKGPTASTPEASDTPAVVDPNATRPRFEGIQLFGLLIILLLFLLPLRTARTYVTRLDQSDSRRARQTWERIMDAKPPQDAILVSNDRNEIVPLFYLQAVEGRAQGNTGLFPLIAPDKRFVDIGATIATALGDGAPQPVYLIKEMPGLEIRFEVAPAGAPLYRVVGPAATGDPTHLVNERMGALTLVGYDWERRGEQVTVALQWLVEDALDADYTTSVQIFDASGHKIGQHDAPPGAVYYPTSLWKANETLVDSHTIALAVNEQPHSMLVGMYTGPDLAPLAPSLTVPLIDPGQSEE